MPEGKDDEADASIANEFFDGNVPRVRLSETVHDQFSLLSGTDRGVVDCERGWRDCLCLKFGAEFGLVPVVEVE